MRRNSIVGGAATQSKPAQEAKRLNNARRPGFPLFAHTTGRWAKKVRGHLHYFGKWDQPQAALELWIEQKDAILAGRKPRKPGPRGLSVIDACNLYLDHVESQVLRGNRSPRWYEDLKRTLTVFADTVGRHWNIDGLEREDFKAVADRFWKAAIPNSKGKSKKKQTRQASPITAKNNIHRVKGLFNWLIKAGHIKQIPAYGTEFDPPDKVAIDRHRDSQQRRYFNRKQVRALLRATKGKPRMHAAILLAINVGCQNEDVATLQLKHLDLRGGWYSQPRSKKAKQRRAKLWPRTIRAINAILKDRKPIKPDDLVFIVHHGGAWHGRNCLAKEFKRVKTAAGIDIPPAACFQWLRHSFITEANQLGDLLAVQLACGHAARSITENYIHKIYDPRLIAIADTVDAWLVGKGGAK